MIFARKLLNGELVDIAYRTSIDYGDGSTDVPLDAIPAGFGPFTHDEANRAAMPLSTAQKRTKEIDSSASSDDAIARLIRSTNRLTIAAIADVASKHNGLMAILKTGRFPTPQEVASLTIQVRDFATLMSVAKQMAVNEVDPTK